MHRRSYYIINAITFYRLIAAPLLVLLVFNHQFEIFRWLLALSFFTDAIDGYLARRYKVSSILGSRLDSIADDLTIVVALTGLIVYKPEFLRQQFPVVILLATLYILQVVLAFIRYGKISSFHTYAAKFAALAQGTFLISFFFFEKPVYILFYTAVVATVIDLIEEIILVLMLPRWRADIKGLYWIMRKNDQSLS